MNDARWSDVGRFLFPLLLTAQQLAAQQDKLSPDQVEYFESKIRPLFVNHCYECHSADVKAKAGLYLDSKAAMLKGGDSGAAIKPGDPGGSLFLQRIKSAVDPMPPNGPQLTADQIADLEAWVRQGAPDPRGGSNAAIIKSQKDADKARQHWAFRPVVRVAPPSGSAIYGGNMAAWANANPIDAFVLARQEKEGMMPSPPADKWTLIRRIYFDLVGMPPTYAQAMAFIDDASPNAWEKVVDGLLASPHYGEQFGRAWLDVARYADTDGRDRRNRGGEFINAWTYRDWVIGSMNSDKPYDRFLVEQLAADRLLAKGESTDKYSQAAMGLLTLGRRDRNNEEMVDDQIDTVTRGALGLSVYCARCHNHKFDPVPTADYYSLFGVFSSSEEVPEEKQPLLLPDATQAGAFGGSPDFLEFRAKLAGLEGDHEQFKLQTRYDFEQNARTNALRYMMWAEFFRDQKQNIRENRGEFEKRTKEFKMRVELGDTWQNYLSRKSATDPVFAPWMAYTALTTNTFAADSPGLALKLSADDAKQKDKGRKINPIVLKHLTQPAPRSLLEVATRYQQLFDSADAIWRTQALPAYYQKKAATKDETLKPPQSLPDAEKNFGLKFAEEGLADQWEQLRRVFHGDNSPCDYPFDRIKRMDNKVERDEQSKHLDKIADLKKTHIGSPPRAMVLVDKPRPSNQRIMVKGNRGQLGDEAPRQFLEILSDGSRKPFPADTSGRLEMAKAIASKSNPLTARVMVNRIWMHHFGRGIVGSANEFGLRAEAPSHPELLDHLASYFMSNEGGPEWTMKKLHKLILMSNTYQQASDDNPRYSRKDPENTFLSKMSRRRLNFESFRDGLLHISGKLDMTMGGRPVKLTSDTLTYRRTLYGYIDRRNLDDIFKTFDFANPDATAGQRSVTTVAQQALFMMNNPMTADLSKRLVSRPEFTQLNSDTGRIAALYNMMYQRLPEPMELKLGLRYLSDETGGGGPAPLTLATSWFSGYGQWARDEKTKLATVRFFHFPYTDGTVWQGSARRPDQQFGNLHLTAKGGHPGQLPAVAVIRRWIAPRDMTVTISGTLQQYLEEKAKDIYDKSSGAPKKGLEAAWDGVTGFIIHTKTLSGQDRSGTELWAADAVRNSKSHNVADVSVRRGDTLDFIVHCRQQPHQDYFNWNPTIKIADGGVKPSSSQSLQVTEWTAADEFQGATYKPKPLNTWEKYVQVLLLSNELAFVD